MRKTKSTEESELDPWTLFLNAMRAPMTRDRYQTRVAKFFDFIKIPGKNLEQRARTFAKKGNKDTNWALSNILKFVYFQRERVDKKEISGATVINHTKSIRLFCDMADIPIQWKKITQPGKMLVVLDKVTDQDSLVIVYSESKSMFYKSLLNVHRLLDLFLLLRNRLLIFLCYIVSLNDEQLFYCREYLSRHYVMYMVGM